MWRARRVTPPRAELVPVGEGFHGDAVDTLGAKCSYRRARATGKSSNAAGVIGVPVSHHDRLDITGKIEYRIEERPVAYRRVDDQRPPRADDVGVGPRPGQ